eukprot:1157570-Pelagomonas_calceolata.AAC.12
MQAQTVGLGGRGSFASRKKPSCSGLASAAVVPRMQAASLSAGLRGFLAGRLMGGAPVPGQQLQRQLCSQPIPYRMQPAASASTDVGGGAHLLTCRNPRLSSHQSLLYIGYIKQGCSQLPLLATDTRSSSVPGNWCSASPLSFVTLRASAPH